MTPGCGVAMVSTGSPQPPHAATSPCRALTDPEDGSTDIATPPSGALPVLLVPPLQDSDRTRTGTDTANGAGSDCTSTAHKPSSVSDVSMPDATDEDTTSRQLPSVTAAPDVTSRDTYPSRKRKSPNDSHLRRRLHLTVHNGSSTESVKKAKLGPYHHDAPSTTSSTRPDLSSLPAEIWHHIFRFCPPLSLGNLLMVNKLFNMYLDPSSPFNSHVPKPFGSGITRILKPDMIWQLSRRFFWPKMPVPLRGKSEIDMWRLIRCTSCEHCGRPGKSDQHLTGHSDSWRQGPGHDSVSIIWPFATRTCGPCLVMRATKEIDLFLSPSVPSFLAPALPFVLMTRELHVLAPSLTDGARIPQSLSPTKLFWSAHIDNIRHEFLRVKEMGPATVEEWIKGLEGRGKDQRIDYLRWEKWTSGGGISQAQGTLFPSRFPNTTPQARSPKTIRARTTASLLTPGDNDTDSRSLESLPIKQASDSNLPPRPSIPDDGEADRCSEQMKPPQHGGVPCPRTGFHQARHERTKEEVADLKAARRSEIERRAMLLDPPVTAKILAHIPSFQAAIQIITPLDNCAWEILKPRLLAQRGHAEQREQEMTAHSRLAKERRNQIASSRESREIMDKDWDEAQGPLRGRIAGFADEVIRDAWDNGRKVTKENCPKFAADVLIYARKRFYAEVTKDAAAARAAGQEPPSDAPGGPFTNKLTLENMKWIFDAKVKPHTEQHRKELFLCSACEGNFRLYGFEGVIQHYAAKHTNTLSLGSIVVYWRAEWPEHSPFEADPRFSKNGCYIPGAQYGYSQVGTADTSSTYGYSGYQTPISTTLPPPVTSSQPYPGQTSPIYGAPYYSDSYQSTTPSFPAQRHDASMAAPYPPYAPQCTAFSGYSPPTGHGPYTATPPTIAHGYGTPASAGPILQGSSAGHYGHNYSAYQSNSYVGYSFAQPSPYADTYRSQLDDLAHDAKELWSSTAGIKDLPGSIRVLVTVHHVVKRYRSRYSDTPPLAMFQDGLSNNKEMRPVRNINGLMCMACTLGLGNGPSVEQDKKYFSFPQLVTHFQTKHIEPMANMEHHVPRLDWTVDMVLIPDLSTLGHLRKLVGSDAQSYYLLADALPGLFKHAQEEYSTQAPIETEILRPNPSPDHCLPTAFNQNPRRIDSLEERFHGNRERQVSHHMPSYSSHVDIPITSRSEPRLLHDKAATTMDNIHTGSPQLLPPISRQGSRGQLAHAKCPELMSAGMQHRGVSGAGESTLALAVPTEEHPSDTGFVRKIPTRQPQSGDLDNPADRLLDQCLAGGGPEVDHGRVPLEREEIRKAEDIRVIWATDQSEVKQARSECCTIRSDTQTTLSTKASHCRPPRSGPRARSPSTAPGRSNLHQARAAQCYHGASDTCHGRVTYKPTLRLAQNGEDYYTDTTYVPPTDPQYMDTSYPPYARGPQRPPEIYARRVNSVDECQPRSGSPAYTQYTQPPETSENQQRSLSRHPGSNYLSQSAPYPVEERAYGRRSITQEYNNNLGVAPPRQPMEQPGEAYEEYELVHLRDEHGEYYIRRPLRRGTEVIYTYADGRITFSREAEAYSSYRHEPSSHQAAPRAPPVFYDQAFPTARVEPPPLRQPAGTAYDEEYDPHYPAAPPSSYRQVNHR